MDPADNRERFEEAHDFIVAAWARPGPFRWEGKHFQYRGVNSWALPLQSRIRRSWCRAPPAPRLLPGPPGTAIR